MGFNSESEIFDGWWSLEEDYFLLPFLEKLAGS